MKMLSEAKSQTSQSLGKMKKITVMMALTALFLMSSFVSAMRYPGINNSLTFVADTIPLLSLLVMGVGGVIAAFTGIVIIVLVIAFLNELLLLPIRLLKEALKGKGKGTSGDLFGSIKY